MTRPPAPRRAAAGTGDPRLLAMSEAAFQSHLVESAQKLGWRTFTIRRSSAESVKSGRMVSFVTSNGWPDVFLVRRERAMAFECKSMRRGAITSQDQLDWLADLNAAGIDASVVRPCDWDAIVEKLR